MRVRRRKWTDEEINKQMAIVAAGGTPARASAALKRSMASCQNQAGAMGKPFVPARTRRRNFSAKCAAAEKESAP